MAVEIKKKIKRDVMEDSSFENGNEMKFEDAEEASESVAVEPPHSIFNLPVITLRYIHTEVTSSADQCILWLQDQGLLSAVKFCSDCGASCSLVFLAKVTDLQGWKCLNSKCMKRYISIRRDTFFGSSHYPLSTLVELLYWWSTDAPQHLVQEEIGVKGPMTIIDWFNRCRDVCTFYLRNNRKPLGGAGAIVELATERYMHSRRYGREGVWVIGLVERANPSNCIMVRCPGNTIDPANLLPIILDNVRSGTTVVGDQVKVFGELRKKAGARKTSRSFITFTNARDEGETCAIREVLAELREKFRLIAGTSQESFESYVSEVIWRRKFHTRVFEHLVSQICDFYVLY